MKRNLLVLCFLFISAVLLAQVPNPVINPSPSHTLTNVSPSIVLTWSNNPGGGVPTGYRVYLGTDTAATNIINGTEDVTTASYNFGGYNYNTKYYWKIVAFNGSGDATGSAIWNFKTYADPTIITFPYNNSFDTAIFPPSGWYTQILTGTHSFSSVTSGANPVTMPHSGARLIQFNGWGSASGEQAIFATAPISTTVPQCSYSVSFWMYRNFGLPSMHDTMMVYCNNQPNLNGSPVALGTINRLINLSPMEIGNDGWYHYSFPFGTPASPYKYIIFKAVSNGGMNMYLDDVTINRTVPSGAYYEITPRDYNFGEIQVNSTSSVTYTIRNAGTSPFTVTGISEENGEGISGLYHSLHYLPVLPAIINGGDSVQFDVQYSPTEIGLFDETYLTIRSSLWPGSYRSYNINGVGCAIAPAPVTDPNPINGQIDMPINPMLSWSNALRGGTPTGYRIYLGTDFPPTNIINGTSTTEMTYNTPMLQGSTQYFWQVVAYNSAGDAIGSSIWNFTTMSGAPNFDISPGDGFNFGRSVINYAIIQTYTMHNTGDLPLAVNSIELSDTTGFAIYSALWLPALIAPGDSLQFELWFTPREIGVSYSTNILINESSQLATHSYLAQGTGSAPGPIITANINGAGTTNYGATIQTFPLLTIYNTGNYELLFSTGPLTAPWITMNPASGFVQTNDSLTFELTFNSNGMTPQNDPYEGILSIITNDSVYPTFDLNMQLFVRNIDSFPFFVNFNELSFPPNGWTTQILSGVAGFEGIITGSAPPCVSPSETRMISFTGSSGSIGDEAYLASPPIEAADSLFAYSVEFNMYRDSGVPGTLDRIDVYSNSTQDLEGTPVLMGTINRLPSLAPVESGGTGWYYYSLSFTPNPSGISYVIFKAICDGGNDMYLDDMIFWKQSLPPAVYSIHPESYDFERRPVNHTATCNYAIYNTGSLPLTVNSIGLMDTTNFVLGSVPLLPLQLSAGDSLNFVLSFTPTIIDEYYETSLTIDESSQPLHTYTICGTGTVEGPIVSSSINSMYFYLENEITFSQPITIYNNGIGDLSYSTGTPTAPWLTIVPPAAVISEGGSLEATLVVNTHGLNPGSYEDSLIINTNDTVFPNYAFSVQMDIYSRTLNPDFYGSPLLGHAPLLVGFTDDSSVGSSLPGTTITGWQWDFQNDGIIDSYEQNPGYTYAQPGSYTVRLVIQNNIGMSSSIVKTDYVSVTNQPPMLNVTIEPIFIAEDAQYGPINLYTYFSDPDFDPLTFHAIRSTHINATISGDSFTLIPVSNWAGVEFIQLSATDPFGGSMSVAVTVTVIPGNDPPVFHLPETMYFIRTTTYSVNLADYITDNDTPLSQISITNMYNLVVPPHIQVSYTPNVPGALTATFTATVGYEGFEDFQILITDNVTRETAETQFRVQVLNAPVAQASVSTTYGFTGQTVHFTDATLGNPNQWTWTFGDGDTSTLANPVHTYLTPGVYNVQLSIKNTSFSNTAYSTTPVGVQMNGLIAQPNVTTHQTWQLSEGQNQYNVFQNINIASGGLLTIGNNVIVNMFDTTCVNVNATGAINANHATFRPQESNTWGGLRFHDSAQISHLTDCTIKNAINPIIIDGGNVQLSQLNIEVVGQLLDIDDTAVQILGTSSPVLHDVSINNYSKGIYIEGDSTITGSAPVLTNIRVTNGNSARENVVKTALEVRGEVNPVIDNIEIKNCDYGVIIDNTNSLNSSTPSLHGVKIYNEPANSSPGKIGLNIVGNVQVALDSLYIDYYNTGLQYQDYTSSNTTTPTLTNIRVRNSTNTSRGTDVGVILNNVKEILFTNSDIDSMSTGIRIQNSESRATSTPTLTNIRVRNSTNTSRSENTGIEITGSVSPQFDDILINNYVQGLTITGTGSSLRTSTPTLTNIRVRNSTNTSRVSTSGIIIKNVLNLIATNDTIDGYSKGIQITNDATRATSTPTLTNIRVRNSTNTSREDNTAIYLGEDVAGTMTDCLIEESQTGIFLADGNQTVLRYNLIKNCGIGLKASGYNPPLSIENNTFKLEADWQAAHAWTYIPIYIQYTGFWNILNNTIWGYPVALEALNANVNFMNNIVWDDADIANPFTLTSSSLQFSYNLIRQTGGFEPEESNIYADPLLVDPDNDDFHLTYNSPCIDAGDPSSIDPDSTIADIGVYYYLHKASFTPLTIVAPTGTLVDFDNTSIGHDYPNTIVAWDLNNDGTIESNDWDWSYQFDTPGIYDIKLILTTDNLVDSLICLDAIVIGTVLLKAPQNVVIEQLDDDIVLSWEAIAENEGNQPAHADYYIVYESTESNGVFQYLNYTSDSETEFTDEGGAAESNKYYLVIGFAGTLDELQDYLEEHGSYPFERGKSKSPYHYKTKK